MKLPTLKNLRVMEKSYRVVALCNGIGGSSIGYEMAGFEVCLSVDKNPRWSEIHRKNLPHIPHLQAPIEILSESDFLKKLIDASRGMDILDVYLPKSQLNTKQTHQGNPFVHHVLRITCQLMPRLIVFHTSGQLKLRQKLILNDLLTILKSIGYTVFLETLKASNYGIPQKKYWVFVLGVRKDYGIKPSFPEPEETMVTTKDAIADLLNEPADVETNHNRLWAAEKYFPPGSNFSYVKKTIRELDLPYHPAYYTRDGWNRPYDALLHTSIRPMHPIRNRVLSLREAKRLQTFPDDFECSDWKEICSSVPPLLIMKVSNALRQGVLRYLDEENRN